MSGSQPKHGVTSSSTFFQSNLSYNLIMRATRYSNIPCSQILSSNHTAKRKIEKYYFYATTSGGSPSIENLGQRQLV